jgi:hypothetical protein
VLNNLRPGRRRIRFSLTGACGGRDVVFLIFLSLFFFISLFSICYLVAARLRRCHSICRPFRHASETIYDGNNVLLSASKREIVWHMSNTLHFWDRHDSEANSWRPRIFDTRWASGARSPCDAVQMSGRIPAPVVMHTDIHTDHSLDRASTSMPAGLRPRPRPHPRLRCRVSALAAIGAIDKQRRVA